MSDFFRLDSPIFRFLATVFDFIILNLVTLILCVPVVTAGAALTALYRVVLSYLDHSNESLAVGRLFREWIGCLKTATLPWIAFLAAVVLLLLDLRIIGYMPEAVRVFMVAGVILMINIVLLTGLFFFPLLSQNPGCRFRELLRQSLQRSIGLLPRMAIIAVFWLLPGALLIFFPRVFIILTFLWIAGWISICVLVSGKLIAPYLHLSAEDAT